MSNTFTSPNMTLVLPVVQGEVGPAWAQELNTAIGTGIDSHDHTTGKGVKVPTAGLNINADLTFNSYKATGLAGSQYTAVAQPSSGTFTRGLYVTSADLYYQDGSGNNIRLTQSGAIIPNGTGAANGFYGEYASVVAHAAYYSTTGSYQLYKNSGESVRANLTVGSIQSVSATTNNFYLGLTGGDAGNTATSVKGGWLLQSSSGTLAFKSDSAASGTYTTEMNLTAIGDGTGDYALTLNGGTANVPLSFLKNSAGGAIVTAADWRRGSQVGATVTGNGIETRYWDAYENKAMASVRSYYASKSTSTNGAAGVQLLGAYNGSIDSVGVEVVKFSGGSAVGLLGAAVSGQGITAYAQIVPNTAGVALGTAGLPWDATIRNLAVTAATSDIIPNNTTHSLGSTSNYWSGVWANELIYRSGSTVVAQTYKSAIWFAISVDAAHNVKSSFETNSLLVSVTPVAAGQVDVVITTPAPAWAPCIATLSDTTNYTQPAGAYVAQNSTTSFRVYTFDNTGAKYTGFTFCILGTGF